MEYRKNGVESEIRKECGYFKSVADLGESVVQTKSLYLMQKKLRGCRSFVDADGVGRFYVSVITTLLDGLTVVSEKNFIRKINELSFVP
jgi:hypothetical protein